MNCGTPSGSFKASDIFENSGIVHTRKHPTTQKLALPQLMNCEI